MQLSFNTRKLAPHIKRVNQKVKKIEIDPKTLEVFGVSKNEGVTITGKSVSKDLGNYFYFTGRKFAYNPYRINIGSIGLTQEDFKGLMSPAYVIFEIDETIYPDFLLLYLKSHIGLGLIHWYSDGGGVRSALRFNDLGKIDFPDLNYKEQERFYKEYLTKKDKIDILLKELNVQRHLLEDLRKSIIQEAFLGELTENWRKENSNIESGDKLLSDINIKKEKLISEKKIKKEKTLSSIKKENMLFGIPNSWQWSRFGSLVKYIEAGKSPKCLPTPALEGQWGVIKISAVTWGAFDELENKALPLNIPPFEDKEIKGGDFLMTRANTAELVARSVIVNNKVRKKLLLNDKTLRVVFFENVNTNYINLYNNSEFARKHYELAAKGTSDSMKNISRDDIKLLCIPIPPLKEQNEIVKQVNKVQKHCKDLDLELQNKKLDAENLLSTILNKILGQEDLSFIEKPPKNTGKKSFSRTIKYDSKTTLMELVELLKKHGKLHAEDLWRMSKHPNDIDAFYAELKKQIEVEKTIKEIKDEKGYLELV